MAAIFKPFFGTAGNRIIDCISGKKLTTDEVEEAVKVLNAIGWWLESPRDSGFACDRMIDAWQRLRGHPALPPYEPGESVAAYDKIRYRKVGP